MLLAWRLRHSCSHLRGEPPTVEPPATSARGSGRWRHSPDTRCMMTAPAASGGTAMEASTPASASTASSLAAGVAFTVGTKGLRTTGSTAALVLPSSSSSSSVADSSLRSASVSSPASYRASSAVVTTRPVASARGCGASPLSSPVSPPASNAASSSLSSLSLARGASGHAMDPASVVTLYMQLRSTVLASTPVSWASHSQVLSACGVSARSRTSLWL